MDYKSIIKSRDTRVKILKLFNWIPDRMMVNMQYRIKFGKRLNLSNPTRFSEKLQWYKLNYHNPLMTKCAGKAEVREYVKERGLEHILNEQYGVYDSADDIDFDILPNRFVIKGTTGAASRQVIVCTDKTKVDSEKIREQISNWISKKPGKSRKNAGREWAYNGVKEQIVIEKYIDSSVCENGLLSYKIFCFNGKAKFIYVIADIKEGFFDAGYGIYDVEFNRLPYSRVGEEHLNWKSGKPDNYDEMIKVAEKLSEGFPHVRVDLYNVNGQIIFGEMTFYNDSGYMKYDPDDFDYIAGNYFELPEKMK